MRVVIAEDSVLLREGLVQILARRKHEVVAAIGDAELLLESVRVHAPDVAIVDVRMPPSFRDEGLQAALQLRLDHPSVGIVVLSQYVETAYAAELLEAARCGVGYLLKDRVGDVVDFLDAVERVAAGGVVIDPEVVRRLIARRRSEPLDQLTGREREVLSLMAEGRSNSAIARRLVVTEAAVAKHVGNIFGKLALEPAEDDHRRVLAVLAYLRGQRR
ncbi:MAG TPA: response regulator transcription factor [Candidatus Dormibacteraeota bacterium]|nr:response regulator transcription factor [Candidatus Dormibacteraeota bacterium]